MLSPNLSDFFIPATPLKRGSSDVLEVVKCDHSALQMCNNESHNRSKRPALHDIFDLGHPAAGAGAAFERQSPLVCLSQDPKNMNSEIHSKSRLSNTMKTTRQPFRKKTSLIAVMRDKLFFVIPRALALTALIALVQRTEAASYTWNVPSGNWSDLTSWTPNTGAGGPLAADSVIFGVNDTSADSSTVNNVVDAGFAGVVSSLTYNSTSATAYNVTQIPSGKTLTVTGPVTVGQQNGVQLVTQAYLTGGGNLTATGTFTVQSYGSAAGANSMGNLNLSGLNTFTFSNSSATLSIADTSSGLTRAGGNLTLAGVKNSITVSNLNVATSSAAQAGPLSTLTFGAGTNIINVRNFNLANNKGSATASFATSTGGLKIRGTTGADTDRATITIGNRNQTGTGTSQGILNLAGHPVDVKAATLTIGANPNTGTPGAAGDFGVGVLQFDTGTVDATTVILGSSATVNLGNANGTLTVGPGGTLIVGTGGLTLLNQSVSENAGFACSGILNISNGTVVCNGSVTVPANVGTGTGGPGTNTINFINGGKLELAGGSFVGSAASPVGNFNLIENSTLQFDAPSSTQTNIVVNSLVWPNNDSALTIIVSGLPATATVGSTIPLIQFATMSGGSFTAPVLSLPAGVTGNLSLNGNTVLLTITGSVFPTLSTISPSLTTLCTNTALTTVASSTVSVITNVQVIVQSTTLGGITTNFSTNTIGSPYLTVTGLGTSTANISYALATNTIYLSVIVQATDANGVTVSLGTMKFDTLVPALVMEASDFNFSNGQFIDTPPNGGLGLYFDQIGTEGIDEHKNTARTGVTSYYRTNDPVVIQAAAPGSGTPPSLTEQKFVTAAANGDLTDVELEVGFNSVGDWLNYTRSFGAGGSAPAGTYNVWCYLATSGSGVQATFSQVTSDPTQGSQTTNLLGYFGTSTFSDNGFNNYVYVPLVDQFGNRVAITIGSGQQTFKSTVVGNPNLAFYLLVPVAPVLTPTLQYNYPDGSVPFQATNAFTFTVSPANGAPIVSSGIHLTVNGSDVSSQLSLSQAGGSWTANYPLQSNSLYTAVINVTNTDGLSMIPYSVSFDTFNINNYQWEAVDYDFSTNDGSGNWIGGQFIDNPVPTCDVNVTQTGQLAANSYFGYPTGLTPGNDGYGAIAQQGIDINFTNTQPATSAYYRADGVGSQPATDYLRPKFLAAQQQLSDPNIGQLNIGYFNSGNWLNYTRHYPTNTYNIWGRLAGGAGAFSGTSLSVVTGGVGTSNQTTQVLGTFADAGPSGWQVYHWVPLLNTNGSKAVVQLGGKATLRLTSGNNLNALFLMLTPTVAVPSFFNIAASLSGGQIQISIPTQTGFNYTLWYAGSLPAASWTQVGGAITGDGSVHVVAQPASGQGYYRVVAQ
jgi:hypothetical protein